MRNARKSVCLLWVIVAVLCVAGAGSVFAADEWIPSPSVITPAPANAYAYDDMSKQFSLEFMTVAWLAQPEPDDDPIKAMFEKEFNLKIKVSFLTPADLISKLTLRCAANDPPDLVFNSGDKASVQKLIDQGFFLTDYDPIINKYGPTLKQSIGSFARISATKDGVLQFIPKGPENADDVWYYVIRKDWLAKLNLKMPTNDVEMLNVLQKFTFNDPDGNGKADTWGITSSGGKAGLGGAMTTFACLFGNPTEFGLEANKVTHPMLNGVQRKMLEYVKKIVDAKVADPDWYTQNWGQQGAKLYSGKVGVVVYPIQSIIAETEAGNGNKGTTLDWWTWVPIMKATTTAGNPMRARNWWTYPGAYWCISTKAGKDEAKLKRVMHFLDNMQYPNRAYYITEGGYGVFPEYKFHGEPGQPWTIDAGSVDPRSTKPGWTALLDWRRNNTVGSLYNATPIPYYKDEIAKKSAELQKKMQTEANANGKNFWERTDLLLNLEPKTVASVRDIANRNEILFVTGQRSFSEWDKYVDEWRKAGGDALIKEAEAQYKQLGMLK